MHAAPGIVPSWLGAPAADRDGQPAGTVADLFFDARTHRPEWLLLAPHEGEPVAVPYGGCRHEADRVVLPVHVERIRTAPASSSPPFELTATRAAALAAHFGVRSGPGPWTQLGGARVRLGVPAGLA